MREQKLKTGVWVSVLIRQTFFLMVLVLSGNLSLGTILTDKKIAVINIIKLFILTYFGRDFSLENFLLHRQI